MDLPMVAFKTAERICGVRGKIISEPSTTSLFSNGALMPYTRVDFDGVFLANSETVALVS